MEFSDNTICRVRILGRDKVQISSASRAAWTDQFLFKRRSFSARDETLRISP